MNELLARQMKKLKTEFVFNKGDEKKNRFEHRMAMRYVRSYELKRREKEMKRRRGLGKHTNE